MDCSLCSRETTATQQIFIEGSVRVLYPRTPVIGPSALIIPLRHVQHFHDLTETEVTDMHTAVKKLQAAFASVYKTSGYNLCVNDGETAGQHIAHVHCHFYGRSEDESESPFLILNDQRRYASRPQISDAQRAETINEIQKHIPAL